MKRKIVFCLGVFVLPTLVALNTTIVTLDNNNVLPFSSLIKMALADEEGQNCPGGSCTHTEYYQGIKIWECEACCPSGKNPECNSYGCTCN